MQKYLHWEPGRLEESTYLQKDPAAPQAEFQQKVTIFLFVLKIYSNKKCILNMHHFNLNGGNIQNNLGLKLHWSISLFKISR